MTYKELQSQKRAYARKERKEIESKLHPNLIVDGVEILHEHLKSGKIQFEAWLQDNPIGNGRSIVLTKEDVLYSDDFYKDYAVEMAWLTIKQKEI
jgi:hypothetical protein